MDGSAVEERFMLGAVIRQARERAGLSLRNLEAITGVSRPTLNRLEHGQIDNPSPAVLLRVAEALELDSDELFSLVGSWPSDALPSLAPYLRAKYHLPPHAVAEINEALCDILDKYDRGPDTQQSSARKVVRKQQSRKGGVL